jgi:acetoin utilization deacetylase AcuC-like enzyme
VTGTALVTSDRFLDPGVPRGEPSSDPFGAERLRIIRRAIDPALPDLPRLEPRPATADELLMVHTEEYVTLVRELSEGLRPRDDYRNLSAEVAVASNTFELASLAAGSVFIAVDEVLGGRARNALVLARRG